MKTTVNRGTIAFILAVACSAAHAAPAAPTEGIRRTRPWGVAAGGSAVFMGDREAPGFMAVGLNVERIVATWLTLDVGLASGLPSTRASANGAVRTDPHLLVRAIARPTLTLDGGRRHALYAGLGPSYLAGRAYGGLWYAHTEVGYQLRASGGFSFLYAIAIDVALNERPPAVSAADCITLSGCPGPVTPGTIAVGPRFALGYTF